MDENIIRRTMPYNAEAEQSVIGALIIDNENIPYVDGIITGDDFYQKQYGIIYDAIIELFGEGKPVDNLTLQAKLREKEVPPEVSSMSYIGELIANVPLSVNAKYYAQIVREQSTLRQLIRASENITNECYAGKSKTDEIMDDTEKAIFDILNSRRTSEFVSIGQTVVEVISKIKETSKTKNPITGIPTGFIDLDRTLTGLHGGEFIIIAARPSMGKTAFALNIAAHASFEKQIPTAFFSLEMSRETLVSRLLSMHAKVDMQKMRTGTLDDDEWATLVESSRVIGKSNLVIDYTPGITMSEFRSKCREYKLKYNIGLIVVDYIQLMSGNGRNGDNRQQEISEISRGLKAIAGEVGVPVVALSQLSRDVEKRSDKRPVMSDLRESGSLEQDADVIMFLYREEYYDKGTEQTNEVEVDIKKQRNGPTGTYKLVFLKEYSRFMNMEKNYEKD